MNFLKLLNLCLLAGLENQAIFIAIDTNADNQKTIHVGTC